MAKIEQAQMGHYDNVLKNWQAGIMGAKPTAENFATAHLLGCRAGKQALARAMELRAGGATDGQVKAACIAGWGASGSHHNKRRDLVGAGYVKAVPTPDNAAGHKVYRIELTAKGTAKVKANGAVKPVTVETKAKPRKAAAKGAAKPAATPATPATPAPVTATSEPAPQPQG